MIWMKKRIIMRIALVAVCLTFVPLTNARANIWDVVGFDAESIGRGNAEIGGASGASALYFNPAGLMRGKRRVADVSILTGVPMLKFDVAANKALNKVAAIKPLDAVSVCDSSQFAGNADPASAQAAQAACEAAAGKYNRYIQAAKHHLEVNERLRKSAEAPRGLYGATVGMVLPLALDPKDAWAAVGVAAYVPFGSILYQRLKSTTVPFFLKYDDAPHRVVVNAGGAVELPWNLRFGFGVDMLVDLKASPSATIIFPPVLTLLPSANLQDIRIVADGAIDIPPTFSPVAGIQYEPLDWLSAGLVYRHEQKVDIDLNAMMELRTGLLKPDKIPISVATSGTFTPTSVGGGVSVKPLKGLTVNLDASWKQWSHYTPPYSVNLEISNISSEMACNVIDSVEGLDQILAAIPDSINLPRKEDGTPDLCGLVQDFLPEKIKANTYDSKADFKDIVEINTGVQYEFDRYKVEAGYAFQPTPVPSQTGIYNILDADTHVMSAGFFAKVKGINLGLTSQYRYLKTTITHKNEGASPVPGLDDFGNVTQDAFPSTTFDAGVIPNFDTEVQNLVEATSQTELFNPAYPSFTVGGGYLVLLLQASMDF